MVIVKAFYVHKEIKGDSESRNENPGEVIMHGKTCEIRDKSLGPAFKIRVPVDYTVYQTECTAAAATSGDAEVHESGYIQPRTTKLKFLLIGNESPPDLSLLDVKSIDRLEFHGSICSDRPVFEITSKLVSIRKVKFFLGTKQTPSFRISMEDDMGDRFVNESVTSLTIHTDRAVQKKVTNEERRLQLETSIEDIIVYILGKSSYCFPSLRKITLDIPFSVRLERAVIQLVDELAYLKPTVIKTDKAGDRLFARRQTETDDKSQDTMPSDTESSSTSSSLASTIDINKDKDKEGLHKESNKSCDELERNLKGTDTEGLHKKSNKSCEELERNLKGTETEKLNGNVDQESLPSVSEKSESIHSSPEALYNPEPVPLTSIQLNTENTEPTSGQLDSPTLTDLGKLLESMLGVSSLGMKSIPAESAVTSESASLPGRADTTG